MCADLTRHQELWDFLDPKEVPPRIPLRSPRIAWDPKPYTPSKYQGPYKPIKTNVTGIEFSENMKHSAKVADKTCVIRPAVKVGPQSGFLN